MKAVVKELGFVFDRVCGGTFEEYADIAVLEKELGRIKKKRDRLKQKETKDPKLFTTEDRRLLQKCNAECVVLDPKVQKVNTIVAVRRNEIQAVDHLIGILRRTSVALGGSITTGVHEPEKKTKESLVHDGLGKEGAESSGGGGKTVVPPEDCSDEWTVKVPNEQRQDLRQLYQDDFLAFIAAASAIYDTTHCKLNYLPCKNSNFVNPAFVTHTVTLLKNGVHASLVAVVTPVTDENGYNLK